MLYKSVNQLYVTTSLEYISIDTTCHNILDQQDQIVEINLRVEVELNVLIMISVVVLVWQKKLEIVRII